MLMGHKPTRFANAFIAVFLAFIFTVVLTSTVRAEDSLEKAKRINDGCLRCHGAQGLKTKFEGKTVSLYVNEKDYAESMHATMPCTYCHTNISDYPHTTALTGKALVKQVNGECQRCHKDTVSMYQKSVHSKLNTKENKNNAYCSDCHGVHNIFKKEEVASTVSHNGVVATCAKCHEKEMKSYEATFHGKSVILGGKEAASCVSCHGSHIITSQDDPASMVNTANVPKTCAECHIYDWDYFQGKEHFHVSPSDPDGAIPFWVLMFFTWLTIIIVSFVLIHIEIELFKKLKDIRKEEAANAQNVSSQNISG